jgi:hypothetical protein
MLHFLLQIAFVFYNDFFDGLQKLNFPSNFDEECKVSLHSLGLKSLVTP